MIYIVQAISFLFAIMLAKHDAPAVIEFENDGVDNKLMSIFHRYNFWVKVLFCAVAGLVASPYWIDSLFYGLTSALWIYLVFDPALNLNRPKVKWHYLGLNDADGRFWNGTFGKNSGKIKAVILSVAIIAVNLIYKFLL